MFLVKLIFEAQIDQVFQYKKLLGTEPLRPLSLHKGVRDPRPFLQYTSIKT